MVPAVPFFVVTEGADPCQVATHLALVGEP